ncbi:MAG: hypothetical protein ACYC9X_00725 [Dehalococcoidia bacterium]
MNLSRTIEGFPRASRIAVYLIVAAATLFVAGVMAAPRAAAALDDHIDKRIMASRAFTSREETRALRRARAVDHRLLLHVVRAVDPSGADEAERTAEKDAMLDEESGATP